MDTFLNDSYQWTDYKSPLENVTVSNCKTLMPSAVDFVNGITVDVMCLLVSAVILTFATSFIFWRLYADLKERTPKQFFTPTAVLCGLYQIVSLSSLLSMFVPKAFVLCDMISHFTFLFGAYQMISLFVSYAGGETAFIKQFSEEQAFNLRTPPCCCCCACIYPSNVTKNKFTFIRLLIAQFILVQGVVFVALNVIYIESADLYNQLFVYVVPVFFTSILLGVWGLNIVTRMMGSQLPHLSLRGKYLALQLVLMANKLQPLIGMILVANVDFDCDYPMTTAVYKHEIVQLIIVCQMFALSSWALRLYRLPVKGTIDRALSLIENDAHRSPLKDLDQ